ncbi:MAG: binding-protein-dependent transport system inner rane component [Solirubrobacterales bacterium]|nr:binding-protein-dependent transport system inner rane component [Solirubrobacterales bacterium]
MSRTQQRIVVWGGLLVAWQIFGMIAGPFYFASVTETGSGLVQFISNGHLTQLAESLRQLLVGYGLSVLVGVPAGIIIGASLIGEATLGVYVRALFVTSLEAMLPFFILLFGAGLQLRVVVVFLFSVLYITINTAAGVRNIDARYIETARSFGASRLQLARHVIVHGALPYIAAGLRLGWGFAVKGMVIAELWVTTGLGGLLRDLGGTRQLDQYFAITLLIVAVGAIGSWAIERVQLLVAPWSEVQRGVRGFKGE